MLSTLYIYIYIYILPLLCGSLSLFLLECLRCGNEDKMSECISNTDLMHLCDFNMTQAHSMHEYKFDADKTHFWDSDTA